MPIVIDRKTGVITSKPQYTQDQRDQLWECLVREWIKQNPGEFAEMMKENKNASE